MHAAPYRQIPLHRRDGSVRAYGLIDARDFDWASKWRWHLSAWGYVERSERYGARCPTCGSRRGPTHKRQVRMHRALLGLTHRDGLEVDHINGDRLDNRRANLRIATRRENAQNVRPQAGRTSSYRGVSVHRQTGLFQAVVHVDGQTHHLGYFQEEENAADTAADFRRQHMPYSADDAI